MIKITTKAYEKMMTYTQLMEDEVTAFILSEDRDEGHTIYDLSLPEQEVTATSAEPSTDEIFEWHKKLPDKHKKNWHGWMHSHHTMGVFASNDDEKTIASLLATMPWVLTIITNHKAEIYCRVDIKHPVAMFRKDVPLIIEPNTRLVNQLRKELEAKCSVREWPRTVVHDYTDPTKGVTGAIGMKNFTPAGGNDALVAAARKRMSQRQEDLQLMKDYEKKAGITKYDETTGILTKTFPDGHVEILAVEVGADDDGSGLLEGGGDDKPLTLQEIYSIAEQKENKT